LQGPINSYTTITNNHTVAPPQMLAPLHLNSQRLSAAGSNNNQDSTRLLAQLQPAEHGQHSMAQQPDQASQVSV